jgi:hypothetical protein
MGGLMTAELHPFAVALQRSPFSAKIPDRKHSSERSVENYAFDVRVNVERRRTEEAD